MERIPLHIISKPTIRRLGKRPFLFYLSVKDRIKYYLAMICYVNSVYICKDVYLGYYHAAGQVQPRRHPEMKQLIKDETASLINTDSYNILEIGSWAGQSAVFWATQLKELGVNGQVLCVDIWNIYGELLSRYRMRNALRNDAIFKLFLHNIMHSGCGEYIKYIRGKSSEILPMLSPSYFNLIYIDGSHKYSYVKQDIDLALKLVIDGGIICGDDLEMQVNELPEYVDLNKVRLGEYDIKEYEYVPTHLGVTVAVHDTFEHVTNNNGFWFVKIHK